MQQYVEYIHNILNNFPTYELSEEDEKGIQANKANWIVKKLTLKKFRKARLEESTKEDILKKVELSIKENKSIYLIICFGGYKHFWNKSYPEADFAELFNLRFMSELVAPILKVHEPGVILDYESEDVILPSIDNFPEEDLDKYAESFRSLIEIYSRNIPSNFKINLVRSQEQLDSKELLKKVQERLPEAKKVWEALPKEEKDKRLHRSPRCVNWRGKEDLTKLTEEEKQKRIEESKIINELYYEVDFEYREDYFVGDNHIPIVLSWGLCDENIDNWLTLGSTYSSVVDFWTGRGVLEDMDGKFVPRILSPNQYNEIRSKLRMVSLDEIPLKNFKELEVYSK